MFKGKWKLSFIFSLVLMLLFSLTFKRVVFAEDAWISFGSEGYTSNGVEDFNVGLYVNSNVPIGTLTVYLEYDEGRLSYVGERGEVSEPGKLIITGINPIVNGKYMLTFRPVSGGSAYIRATDAKMYLRDNPGEEFNIVSLEEVYIEIEGEDVLGEKERLANEEAERIETEGLLAENVEEEDISGKVETSFDGVYAAPGGLDPSEESKTYAQKNYDLVVFNPFIFLGVVAVLLIITINVLIFTLFRGRKKTKKRKRVEEKLREKRQVKRERTGPPTNWREPPAIRVLNVTMEYELAVENPNGLKDYIIRLLKRQIKYRSLYALNDVSFDVYKGEVVGIIGTNGSGKSTLLKIVSGALKPTCGRVKVDREKLQILTLGTGFDAELTGRENVYLNGAIIGYSKEFLDEHYDEIVSFAELSDFMEEKVKNYSSGMVSRLGFAIATAGEASEILILDEVLSVGDEFFRKKSLARIKEMIHGGSTVLMVSHSMATILENCTKCVWIEKGELRMIGEPEVVCREYQRMGNA